MALAASVAARRAACGVCGAGRKRKLAAQHATGPGAGLAGARLATVTVGLTEDTWGLAVAAM